MAFKQVIIRRVGPLFWLLDGMRIKATVIEEAEEISNLIRSLSSPFFSSPNGEGADTFLESISPKAIGKYISSDNFVYLTGKIDAQLVGVVAIRDSKHLFHLFVSPSFQSKGFGRRLWNEAKEIALKAGNGGEFTVNSSLNAVPIYAAFGFNAVGEERTASGISFQPMVLSVHTNAF
jgi:GNAT superfamily N-acetyltransferase